MSRAVLEKVKQPGERLFTFEMWPIADDAHGHWFHMPIGARWSAPHASGVLTVDAVVLLQGTTPWVAWWVSHADEMRLEVDICLPPARTAQVWRFVDLELDVFRYRDSGRVTLEDRDEFDEAVAAGVILHDTAALAERTAEEVGAVLTKGEQGWILRGWELLDGLVSSRAGTD